MPDQRNGTGPPWGVRTKDKDETVQQLGDLAVVVPEKHSDGTDQDGTELARMLKDADGNTEKALDRLKQDIKGFGKTSRSILRRRTQWLWEDAFPFIDERRSEGLEAIGQPEYANELKAAIEQHRKQLSTGKLAGDDEAAKKRRVFVIILGRATGRSWRARLVI